MLAGTIGLHRPCSLQGMFFCWLSEETLEQIQHELGYLVSHLMAVGLIALALRTGIKKKNTDIVNTGYAIVKTYMVQGIIGLVISLLLVRFVYPDLFPPLGMLLPAGFCPGPGSGSEHRH